MKRRDAFWMKTTLIHAAVVAVLLTPLAATSADEKLTPAEAKEIAKEAFLWGMHPVAIYHLRYNFVQHDEPSDPKQRQNWLPAPKDAFQFAARFYGPSTPLIAGSYDMPGVVRVD